MEQIHSRSHCLHNVLSLQGSEGLQEVQRGQEVAISLIVVKFQGVLEFNLRVHDTKMIL